MVAHVRNTNEGMHTAKNNYSVIKQTRELHTSGLRKLVVSSKQPGGLNSNPTILMNAHFRLCKLVVALTER